MGDLRSRVLKQGCRGDLSGFGLIWFVLCGVLVVMVEGKVRYVLGLVCLSGAYSKGVF